MHIQEHMLLYLEAMLCLMCDSVKCRKCCVFYIICMYVYNLCVMSIFFVFNPYPANVENMVSS